MEKMPYQKCQNIKVFSRGKIYCAFHVTLKPPLVQKVG